MLQASQTPLGPCSTPQSPKKERIPLPSTFLPSPLVTVFTTHRRPPGPADRPTYGGLLAGGGGGEFDDGGDDGDDDGDKK